MPVTLRRWGNGIGPRLPKPLSEQLGLKEGSKVELKIEGGRLVIEPARRSRLRSTGRPRSLVATDLPDQDDLAWINFDPRAGREQAKHRPALILTAADFNAAPGCWLCVLSPAPGDRGVRGSR